MQTELQAPVDCVTVHAPHAPMRSQTLSPVQARSRHGSPQQGVSGLLRRQKPAVRFNRNFKIKSVVVPGGIMPSGAPRNEQRLTWSAVNITVIHANHCYSVRPQLNHEIVRTVNAQHTRFWRTLTRNTRFALKV